MVLTFSTVSKTYGGVHALRKASLTLKSGEIRALLGGNGSGKSTLIKVASGIVRQDEGEVLIDNKEVSANSPVASKKLKLVSTSQELSILSNLTVEENITLCRIPHQSIFTDRKAMRNEAEMVLERLGLEADIDVPVDKLPINKQYLIEFGKAIVQDFDVLMIDEITSALYREDVEVVKRVLNEYKAQGKIILFVSHRMSEIFSICDTVSVMRNGEVIATYDLDKVSSDALLADMIGNGGGEGVQAEAEVSAETASKRASSATHEKQVLVSVKGLPIARYGSKIDLDVMKGEIIGVAGLQGHGQSDIVRALHGLSGGIDIVLRGNAVHIDKPRMAVKQGFAYVSGDRERDGAFRSHDLSDNIKVVQELILKKGKTDANAVLNQLDVKYDTASQSITSLSGGNQQKVILGRWTHTKPLLLLADDPSKGIDVRARGELREILWKLAEEGMAMVFVSSDEDELVAFCQPVDNSRIIVLYEGNIIATLRGSEITRDNIIAATLGKGGVAAL